MSAMGYSFDVGVTVDVLGGKPKTFVSTAGLLTIQAAPVTALTLAVPSGRRWLLYATRAVCRAYGQLVVAVDGVEADRCVSSANESNPSIQASLIPFGTAEAGQIVTAVFTQEHGPTTDLRVTLFVAEATL